MDSSPENTISTNREKTKKKTRQVAVNTELPFLSVNNKPVTASWV